MEEQDQRITDILGAENLAVTFESLTIYRDYLSKNLDTPCRMTGIEDFQWEGKYILGYADEAEHEAPKDNQPSRTDVYELKRFEELIDENTGILVKVRRVKDNKRFILDLASLKAVGETSKNFMLLDDYAAWFNSKPLNML
jgi:hypothetical protein